MKDRSNVENESTNFCCGNTFDEMIFFAFLQYSKKEEFLVRIEVKPSNTN
jgi:hypothetical protein